MRTEMLRIFDDVNVRINDIFESHEKNFEVFGDWLSQFETELNQIRREKQFEHKLNTLIDIYKILIKKSEVLE